VGSPLIWLSGAQPDILAQCRHDRAKYIGVGSAVLVTSSMAAVSMAFALHIALDAQLPVAVPFALAWGLAIMSLDRWLVVSLVRQSPLRYFMLALPRLLLGLLFGVIISTPLTLQIFHVEIANQIALDHTNALAAYNSSTQVQSLQTKINTDTTTVANDNKVINSGGASSARPASSDQALTEAQNQLTADRQQAEHFSQAARCELYGGTGCSSVVGGAIELGTGPQYQYDEQQLAIYNGKVSQDTTAVAKAQQQFNAESTAQQQDAVTSAQAKRTKDTATLNNDTAQLNALKASYVGTLTKDTGILASLKALDELRGSNGVLLLADLLLFLFFTAIEWLPILVKALLNLGPENTYEKLLAKAEEASLRNADNEATRQYLASVRDMDVATDGGYRFNDEWERAVLPDLMRDAIAARERVARVRLRRWEQHATADGTRIGYDDIFTPGAPPRGAQAPTFDWLRGNGSGKAHSANLVRKAGARLAAAWRALVGGETPQRRRPRPGPGLASTGPQPRYSDGF
jgi:hypothetical protein